MTLLCMAANVYFCAQQTMSPSEAQRALRVPQ